MRGIRAISVPSACRKAIDAFLSASTESRNASMLFGETPRVITPRNAPVGDEILWPKTMVQLPTRRLRSSATQRSVRAPDVDADDVRQSAQLGFQQRMGLRARHRAGEVLRRQARQR